MVLFKTYGNPAADMGEWFEFGPDPDSGRIVRFRVRRIPASVERAIRGRQNMQVRSVKGGQEVTVDLDRERSISLRRAVYALVDSENFDGQAEDSAAVALYSKLLEVGDLEVGKPFTFDKRWAEGVREHVLGEFPALAAWIIERAERLQLKASGDEETAEGN